MNDKIEQIHPFLETDFEKELLNASVAYIAKTDDPLRFNSFSASMRELSRHILQRLAPDDEVKKCKWFTVETDNGAPTRQQRITYAIQGGLSSKFVEEELYIDATEESKKAIKSIKLLSKFTHVNEKTFNLPQEECETHAESVLASFIQIFLIIDETRREIQRSVHDYITDEIVGIFLSNTFDDLDILSTHTIAELPSLELFKIDDINSERIIISGYGIIEVSLNYGQGNDATELHDSFPFDFNCYSEIDRPKNIIINTHDIKVDTSSWYE